MNLPWRQKLPTGEALRAEAARVGLHFDPGDRKNDAELQQRVLVAWVERRNAVVNYTQTFAIIGTLLITLVLAIWNEQRQSNQESADLMIKFSEMLASGKSGLVAETLDLNGNLEQAKNVDDEAIDEFLGNYDLLAAAYRHGLINKDMADDAFSYDLEKALQDRRIRAFSLSRGRKNPMCMRAFSNLRAAGKSRFLHSLQSNRTPRRPRRHRLFPLVDFRLSHPDNQP